MELDLDDDKVKPDPAGIVEAWKANGRPKEFILKKAKRLHELLPERTTGYGDFAVMYRRSLEFAWLSICSLLSSNERIRVSEENGERRLIVSGSKKELQDLAEKTDRDIKRAAIVPEVMSSILYDFVQQLSPARFCMAFNELDARARTRMDKARIPIIISEANFVRTSVEAVENEYYSLDKLDSYGFASGRTLEYPTRVLEYPDPEKCTSYLCYPSFTHDDYSGLNFAIRKKNHDRDGDRWTDTVWWHNHHRCKAGLCCDAIGECPASHFESTRETRVWRDNSIAPYLSSRQIFLENASILNSALFLSFGVKFGQELLGLFLGIGIAAEDNLSEKDETELMKGLRAHAGHIRYSMLANLAQEISATQKELSDARKRHGEMLSLLDAPIENLRRRVLDAIDDARRITQIIKGPQMVPFIKAAEVSHYFEQDVVETIGVVSCKILHNPDDYETKFLFKQQVAVFSAIIIKLFGASWQVDDGASELFQRASLLMFKQNANQEDERLSKVLRVLTGISTLDVRNQIERDIDLAGKKGQTVKNRTITTSLHNLKNVIYYPFKEYYTTYHWQPLLLVLLGDETKRCKVTYSDLEKEKPMSNLEKAIRWSERTRGGLSFLDGRNLPVPRYEMLLVFLSNVITFFHNELVRKEKSDRENPITIRREKGDNWTIELDFGFHLDNPSGLAEQMKNCHKAHAWPTYVGDLYGPYLAWAAQCGGEGYQALEDARGPPPVFAVKYASTVSTIGFVDGKLVMRFLNS